jgi:alpha-tubulin suppressor-like RCC1 family protein
MSFIGGYHTGTDIYFYWLDWNNMNKIVGSICALLLLFGLIGCGGGKTTTTVVAPPKLLSITVTPTDPTIALGAGQQFVATGTYSDGSTADLSASAKWTSGGSAVSILYTSGMATAKAAGVETITATVGTVSGNTRLTVKAPYTAVSAGGSHTVSLKVDGTLYAWGRNQAGQLGDGTYTDRLVPTWIGTVKTWATIATGELHTVAIRSDGTLWGWGFNQNGQLGDGTFANKPAPVKIGAATTWVALSAGKAHTVAIKKDGTLWAWGGNYSGQLGDGTLIDSPVPIQIGTFTNWTAASAGAAHTVGRRADGTIWSWGDNSKGQLGRSSNTAPNSPFLPVQIGSEHWVSVAAGGAHTLAIRSDGALFSWGSDGSRQLGHDKPGDMAVPTQVGVDTHWALLAAGGSHSLALKSDGTLWAWGSNSEAQLGDGTTVDASPPMQIGTGTGWLAISAGLYDSFGFLADGTLWGWGRNLEGQQGNGSLIGPLLVPTRLP